MWKAYINFKVWITKNEGSNNKLKQIHLDYKNCKESDVYVVNIVESDSV